MLHIKYQYIYGYKKGLFATNKFLLKNDLPIKKQTNIYI